MKIKRRKTRTVAIGNVKIGSSHAVAVQSMVKCKAKDVGASVRQIRRLEEAGCEIVRIAVEDGRDALSLAQIKRRVRLPLVADVHFDYRLALASIRAGADKIRLNPGNIYKPHQVREVIAAARDAHVPIRIGVNSGSLRVRGKSQADSLVKGVTEYLRHFKRAHFDNLVISLKGSDPLQTIAAYERLAGLCDYPLHLGITATGLLSEGIVKSSAVLGVLLFKGIGDTIRISLLADPVQEVLAGQLLLSSLGLRRFGPELICCPTCGRCEVDLLKKAEKFQSRINQLSAGDRDSLKDAKIALMGCIVNGPGEGRQADLGIAFSKKKGVLFKKGKVVRSISLEQGEEGLFALLKTIVKRS